MPEPKAKSEVAEIDEMARKLFWALLKSIRPGAKEASMLLCNLMVMLSNENASALQQCADYSDAFTTDADEWPDVIDTGEGNN